MDKNKMILIIGTVLIVMALALSAVSLIKISTVLKKVSAVGTEGTAVTAEEAEKVPISETVNFDLTEPMIGTLPSTLDPARYANVSIEIGFRLKEGKKTEALRTLMTANEKVLRDRISKVLATKTLEEYQEPGFVDAFQLEILELVSKELDTELIVDVYFSNNLKSIK